MKHALIVVPLLLAAPGPVPVGTPQSAGVLVRYDFEHSSRVFTLPAALDEISGLAFDGRGALWAHQDEVARLFRIDPAGGEVRASFDVGRWGWTRSGDWEGVAWARGELFLVDSDGVLLRFAPGDDGERVAYRRIPTGLGRRCEIEGLTFLPDRGSFLMGCKTPRARDLRNRTVLLAYSLDSMRPEAELVLSSAELARFDVSGRLAISAVEVHPEVGTILVAAARQGTLLELDSTGGVLAARRLSEDVLPQVEGLAVGPGGALFLASEASGGPARLVRVSPSVRTP